MIYIYLKTAFQNFKKQLTLSVISGIGLTVGFLCVIIIGLWINSEINFNADFSNSKRIYKVFIEEKRDNSVQRYDWTSFPLAKELVTNFPEIENATCCTNANITVKFNSNVFNESRVCFTDDSFFKIFDFPFISGDKENALSKINSIIITEKVAKKYFGDNDAIGKSLLVNNKYTFLITGVLKDITSNTDFQFDFFLRAKEFAPELAFSSTNWEALNFQTYLITTQNSNTKIVSEKIRNLMVQNIQGSQQFLDIQPLKIAHLYNVYGNPTGIKKIYIFSAIAILTLLIAYINFINLSVVSYHKRISEFVIKRIIGSGKKHLYLQVFTDSLLLVLISAVCALILSSIFIPLFNEVAGKELNPIFFNRKIFQLFTIVVFSSVPLLSIPSVLVLSLKSMQGSIKKQKNTNPNLSYRNILLTVQFIIAIVLIVSTIISTKQMNFMLKKETGLDLENVIYVRMNGDSRERHLTLKNELLKAPDITNITYSYNLPTSINTSCQINSWAGGLNQNKLDVAYTVGDFDYVKTMGLEIVEGRDFSSQRANDYNNYILNETAIEALGLESPIGTIIDFSCWRKGEIIGVVKDFNFSSLHSNIRPLVIASPEWGYHYLIVKTASVDYASVVDKIEENWLRINPEYPYEYNFLEDTISLKYLSETRQKDILMSFTLMSIVLSLMGLFGLVGLTVQNRTKEIGIRKVNGAKISEILSMLNNDFIKWVAIAFVVAVPIAYFTMYKWLENFAYKTNLSWWIFALAGLLALGIALLTVSWQSWRAATRNPVEALRYE